MAKFSCCARCFDKIALRRSCIYGLSSASGRPTFLAALPPSPEQLSRIHIPLPMNLTTVARPFKVNDPKLRYSYRLLGILSFEKILPI